MPVWPKHFQNLRSSRATELANEYPVHVAATWLGRPVIVANKHYWQVTDADFEAAARGNVAAGTIAAAPKNASEKAAQSMQENGRNGGALEISAQQKTPVFPGFAESRVSWQDAEMGGTGLEPSRQTREIVGVSTEAAQNAAHAAHGNDSTSQVTSLTPAHQAGPTKRPSTRQSQATSQAASTIPVEAAGTPIDGPIDKATEAHSDSGIDLSFDKPIDADLTRVVEAWPALPAAIRAGILAMIRAAS